MDCQEDYTETHKVIYDKFVAVLEGAARYSFDQDLVIDGLNVVAVVQKLEFTLRLTLEATRGCKNGFMFHKDCKHYESIVLFAKYFKTGADRDFGIAFNNIMDFYKTEVPRMKLRGDHLMTMKQYDHETSAEELAREQQFFEEKPDYCCPNSACRVPVKNFHIYDICQESEISFEKLRKEFKAEGSCIVPGITSPMCIKCFITFPLFDMTKHNPSQMVNLRDNKFVLDRSQGRVFRNIRGITLVKISHQACDCEEEEEEEDFAIGNEDGCEDWDNEDVA